MKQKVSAIRRILRVAQRECGILTRTPIYLFCMIIFPIFIIFFFTSMMNSGQPQEMPVGIVDLEHYNYSLTCPETGCFPDFTSSGSLRYSHRSQASHAAK